MRGRKLKELTFKRWLQRSSKEKRRIRKLYKPEQKLTYWEALQQDGYSFNAD
jgi:hypothetical protein